MPKYEPHPEISGADAMLSLLAFLQNPMQVKTRLHELLAVRDEINATVARAGKAEAIDELHASAVENRRKADDEFREAREKAAATVKAAFVARDAALKEAESTREFIASGRAALAVEKADWRVEALRRRDALDALHAEAEAARTVAAAMVRDVEALKAEWTEKVERLKAAGVILGVPA